MGIRIIASCALLFSLLFLPFWVSAILGIAGIIIFPYYFEAVALFLMSDLLYGAAEARFFYVSIVGLIVGGVVLASAEFLKKKLRFYETLKR